MSVLIVLVPLALCLSLFFMGAFIWATRSGQWDDIELAPYKMIEKPHQEEETHASKD